MPEPYNPQVSLIEAFEASSQLLVGVHQVRSLLDGNRSYEALRKVVELEQLAKHVVTRFELIQNHLAEPGRLDEE